jgi:hypothetical protein
VFQTRREFVVSIGCAAASTASRCAGAIREVDDEPVRIRVMRSGLSAQFCTVYVFACGPAKDDTCETVTLFQDVLGQELIACTRRLSGRLGVAIATVQVDSPRLFVAIAGFTSGNRFVAAKQIG